MGIILVTRANKSKVVEIRCLLTIRVTIKAPTLHIIAGQTNTRMGNYLDTHSVILSGAKNL